MWRFLLRRLALALPMALGTATLVFLLMETAPGDPADLLLGDLPVPLEVRQRIETAYGLDQPPLARYLHWLRALCLEGELGWSHSRSRPVRRAIAEALPPTLLLAGTALCLHVLLGIALGVVTAARRGRWADRGLSTVGLLLYAMPTFWLGLMAILALSYLVPMFPASSMRSVMADDWGTPRRLLDLAWHLALPASVLGVASSAAMARFVRSGLLDALGRDFVRAARARGVAGSRVLWVHALRHALLPVVNLVGLSLPVLFSGSLVVEVVFAWPGMGRLTYDAIRAQDVSVVLGCTLLMSMLVIVGSLAADLAMAIVDPRIRLDDSRSRR